VCNFYSTYTPFRPHNTTLRAKCWRPPKHLFAYHTKKLLAATPLYGISNL